MAPLTLHSFPTRRSSDLCSRAFSINSGEFQDRSEFQAKFVSALKDVKNMLVQEELEATVQEAQDLAQDSIEGRSEEHTSELQSRENLVCRLLLENKKSKD